MSHPGERQLATPLAPAGGRRVDDAYVPGACNIGTWEIRRRRAFALVGFAVAVLLFAVLVATDSPAWTRLLVFVPLTGGLVSWLQARRHFCAAYAWRGIANFADTEAGIRSVQDEAARRADLAAIGRMARDAALIGLAITLVAVLLPV